MEYSELIQFLSDTFQFPVTDATSATPSSDTDINNQLPIILDQSEQRIYTDMDMLQARMQDYSKTCTANSRSLTLPVGTMVVEGVSIISQVGSTPVTSPAVGKRNPCERMSLDFIDTCCPQEKPGTGIPSYYAPLDAQTIVLAQTPLSAYMVEITGTKRPASISSINTETYISQNYPQLLQSAAGLSFAIYQKNQASIALFENQYNGFIKTAIAEEKRRRGESITVSSSTPKAPRQEEDE